jgi:LPS export ABC transporter protein LptC
MSPRSIKVLRRWLIGIIICVLLAVISNYALFLRRRSGHHKKPAELLNSETTRTAEGIEYSDNKNGVTRFKIHALRLVETREGKSFLEGIEAYDFSPDGAIHDKIKSQKAVFDNERKLVDFSGNVQLFFGKSLEMRTESLQYDLNANTGSTQGMLRLSSQSASGKARGMRFNKDQESFQLGSEVDFIIQRKTSPSGNPMEAENMHAISEQAYVDGKQNHIVFRGKARIEANNTGALSGDSIEVSLSEDRKHVVSMIATGSAAYRTDDRGESRILSGDRMLFTIGESDVLEKISVVGQAALVLRSATEEKNLNGGQIDLEFDAAKGTISQIQGDRGVLFRMKRGMEQTLMSGGRLQARFVPETGALASVHVENNAKFSTEGAKDSASNVLQAKDIRVSFRQIQERIAMEKIRADGSVRWLSVPPENSTAKNREPARELNASLLEFLYSNDGDYLESGIASGKVLISEGTGGQPIQPQMNRMLADSVRFHFFQKNGQLKNMNAEGHVKTTYEHKRTDPKDGSISEPLHTTSDNMTALFSLKDGRSVLESATQWGNFTYQEAAHSATAGKCDYDAGKGMLILRESPRISDNMSSTTGEKIDYDQKQKTLFVHGNVQSKMSPQKGGGSFFVSSAPTASSPSIIMADEMQYWTELGQFRYSGKVRSISENQQLNAQLLEIFNSGERVEAQGDVRHLVRETAQSNRLKETRKTSQPAMQSKGSSPSFITIRSEHLKYVKTNNEIAYSGNVIVTSEDVSVSSSNFLANLDQDGTIKHATAKGKVHIVQKGGRKSNSDVANWSLDAGKFELEGAPAEVFDPARGRSRAPRLTYFKANDRILLGK